VIAPRPIAEILFLQAVVAPSAQRSAAVARRWSVDAVAVNRGQAGRLDAEAAALAEPNGL
jgi:hypothetical protein